MHPPEPRLEAGEFIEVSRVDRWTVCLRLQELGIVCKCSSEQPLWAEINTVAASVQLWSVVRQLTSSRQELVQGLERCWQISK